MKKLILIVAIIVLFCTTMFLLSAQNAEKPKVVGLAVTIAVDGVKDQAAFDALATDLVKTAGIAEITTNIKTGILTATIDESKVTLGDLVNIIAKHPKLDDAEKFYGAKIVCYINSRTEEKAEKLSDATKTNVIATIKKRPGIVDITLSDDGRTAKIAIAATAKTRVGNLGQWFGHGLGMMVNTAGPVTNFIPNENRACNQCHAHMPK
ncbi:MAG: hypothetical protein WCO98_15630 [bacterium]